MGEIAGEDGWTRWLDRMVRKDSWMILLDEIVE